MDKVYDFNWLVQEIDNCLVIKLSNGKKALGIYQASEILSIDMDKLQVRFANTADLIDLVSNSIMRFMHVRDPKKIIDIPIRNLYTLFLNGNELGITKEKTIKFDDLEAFVMGQDDEEFKDNKYLIYAYKVNTESEELLEMLKIAHEYNKMEMNEKFEALIKVNSINYQREKSERRI